MKYKITNITNFPKRFWVRKSPQIFILKPKDTIIIDYEPMGKLYHFKIEKLDNIEKKKPYGVTPRKKRIKIRKKE
jgi:hypothetical protein